MCLVHKLIKLICHIHMSSISYAAILKHYLRDACLTPNSVIFSNGSFSCDCISTVFREVEWRVFIQRAHIRLKQGGAKSKVRTYLKLALFQAFTLMSLNPLSPNSDHLQFPPNKIHMLPREMVMRVHKMVT